MRVSTLKTKLILAGIFMAITPIIIIISLSWWKITQTMTRTVQLQTERFATSLAASADLIIRQQLRIAESLATAYSSFGGMDIDFYGGPSIDELTERRLNQRLLKNLQKLGEDFESISIGDRNGVLFAGTTLEGQTPFKGRDISRSIEFKTARDTLAATGSKVKRSEQTQMPVMVFYAPILNKGETFAGLLALTMKMDVLSDWVAELRYGETGYAFMLDADGTVVAHPRKDLVLSTNIREIEGMEDIAAGIAEGRTGVSLYRFEGLERMGGVTPVDSIGGAVAVTQNRDEWMSPARSLRNLSIPLLAVVLLLAALGGGLAARRIVTPIRKVIEGLGTAASEVDHAALDLANSSRQVFEAAATQASSIEEVSAALEEISSVAQSNADHAAHTKSLVNETTEIVRTVSSDMSSLDQSMQEIKAGSQKAHNITSTIDNIAFQTNLLALNAAVEAARAGEAGSGFAVVADEVRSLAIRTSEAAKNITAIISSSVEEISKGREIVDQTLTSTEGLRSKVLKLVQITAHIASASNEQADSVIHIHSAVSQIDQKTTESTVGEQAASTASEYLSSDARNLKTWVSDLIGLVEGGNGSNGIVYSSRKPPALDVPVDSVPTKLIAN